MDYLTLICTNPNCRYIWTSDYTFDCGKALRDPCCEMCGSEGERMPYQELLAEKIDKREDER